MDYLHPPDVVTLSRNNTGLGSTESTSPLPSAPNSPRGSPARIDPSFSSSSLEPTTQGRWEEQMLSPPQQHHPTHSAHHYHQHSAPQSFAPGTAVNASFQDDEEQDEAAHLDYNPEDPLNSILVMDEDDGRETPFDEDVVLQLLDEKKEIDMADHSQLVWSTNDPVTSSMGPSLDEGDDDDDEHNNENDAALDGVNDDDSQEPPSLSAADRLDGSHPPAIVHSILPVPPVPDHSHPPVLSTPLPGTTRRNQNETIQDPDSLIQPASYDNQQRNTNNPMNTTMMMMTPDQQLKSPPVLVKTTNLEWILPNEQEPQRAVVHGGTSSPSAIGMTLDDDDDDDEVPIDERSLPTLPVTFQNTRISTEGSADYGQGVRSRWEEEEAMEDEADADDVMEDVDALVVQKSRASAISEGKHLPKPATLRSISAPIHAMYADMTTSQFSSLEEDQVLPSVPAVDVEDASTRDSPLALVDERPERVVRSVSDIPRSSSMNDWKKYLIDDDQVKGITDLSQWLDHDDQKNVEPKRTNFRDMTPKQDFKLSEKSAAWLQEEFKRRSTIKKEINEAILARSDLRKEDDEIIADGSFQIEDVVPGTHFRMGQPVGDDREDAFAKALSMALKALPTSPIPIHNSITGDISQHSEDDEVAALTTFKSTSKSFEGIKAIPSDEDAAPMPRRLDYGSTNTRPLSVPAVISANPATPGPHNGDFRQDMLRFANETRNVLHGRNLSAEQSDEFIPRYLSSADVEESSIDANGALRPTNISAITDDASDHTPLDFSTTPLLVESMDSYLGISKGDITLSLLNEDNSISAKSTWANRVRVAVWRARRMRRGFGGNSHVQEDRAPGTPAKRGSSLHGDIDRARVSGSVRTVQGLQDAALGHLMHDEVDEALELFEDIIFAYYHYFERSLKAREANPGVHHASTDFRPYIGAALHNLGILNLLKGEYNQALSYFGRAVDNRRGCLGESHRDHVASLVKLATCHYAVNEFAEAHARFELALEYARNEAKRIDDRMQMAEILNNLGCLAYMCGQPSAASAFFRESMDVQFNLMGQSLYLCSAAVGQSISLNLSITRANIGFIKLVTSELSVAVTALENALMEQQLLLTGASPSLLATMDHLAVANLLNGDPGKAAMMFGRILELQRRQYGSQDSRCFVTVDKINMVKSSGTKFEEAVAELRKTFSLPEAGSRSSPAKPKQERAAPSQGASTPSKSKNQKNKVMKVLTSIRKKK